MIAITGFGLPGPQRPPTAIPTPKLQAGDMNITTPVLALPIMLPIKEQGCLARPRLVVGVLLGLLERVLLVGVLPVGALGGVSLV